MFTSLDQFLRAIKTAPCLSKDAFVLQQARGRHVLDLGCVQHTIEFVDQWPDRWLHNTIRAEAASVLGVDLLTDEVQLLRERGYEIITGDATRLRLDRKFEVVVCGDLIEHLTDPGAVLTTMAHHLEPDGVGVITTPSPFGIQRFADILFDGWTGINTEHTCWFCPQTMFQLVERCGFNIETFGWLETSSDAASTRRPIARLAHGVGSWLASRNRMFQADFGVVVKRAHPRPSL